MSSIVVPPSATLVDAPEQPAHYTTLLLFFQLFREIFLIRKREHVRDRKENLPIELCFVERKGDGDTYVYPTRQFHTISTQTR